MLETKIIEFFEDLSAVQDTTLEILKRKTRVLALADTQQLSGIIAEEKDVVELLQQCLARREKLLQEAKDENLPCDTIESLARHLDKEKPDLFLRDLCTESKNRTRLMQLQSLTNQVLVQRTTHHFSQILDMIATKGRHGTTYDRKRNVENFNSGGALVDLGG